MYFFETYLEYSSGQFSVGYGSSHTSRMCPNSSGSTPRLWQTSSRLYDTNLGSPAKQSLMPAVTVILNCALAHSVAIVSHNSNNVRFMWYRSGLLGLYFFSLPCIIIFIVRACNKTLSCGLRGLRNIILKRFITLVLLVLAAKIRLFSYTAIGYPVEFFFEEFLL